MSYVCVHVEWFIKSTCFHFKWELGVCRMQSFYVEGNYTLLKQLKVMWLSMLHYVQRCHAEYHRQEREYSNWNYGENEDFISISIRTYHMHRNSQMNMTRRLLSIPVKSKVAGDKILNNTSNWQNLLHTNFKRMTTRQKRWVTYTCYDNPWKQIQFRVVASEWNYEHRKP